MEYYAVDAVSVGDIVGEFHLTVEVGVDEKLET